jgi:diguanylate cyclase (GGDEF)-like protein/PAS domain S-box-containing protein
MMAHLQRKWQGTGLGLRLVVAIVLVVFCGTSARSVYLVLDEKAEALTRYQEEMTEARLILAPVLLSSAVLGNPDAVARMLRLQVDARSDLDLIRWQYRGENRVEKDTVSLQLQAPPWFVQMVGLRSIETTALLVPNDPSAGVLTLRTTPVPVVNKLWRRFREQLPVLGVLATLMLAWVALIMRANLRTLNELVLAAQRFRGGELSVHVAELGAPELRSVASAFNAMALELGGKVRAMQDDEAKSRALFEDAADPMLLMQGWAFTDCNAATLAQSGYGNRQEFLQLRLDQVFPQVQPDGSSSVEKINAYKTAALTSGYQRFDWVYLRKDGTPVPVEVTLTPIHIKDQVVYHILWRDITQRLAQERSVAEAQSQLRATLDAIPDLLFEVSLDGKVFTLHSRRGDLIAAPSESYVGRHLSDFLPHDAAHVCHQALVEAHTSGHCEGYQYAVDLPRGRVWFELSIAGKAVAPGQEPRFIMLARDITERQQHLEDVSWQAGHDALTGLPNRMLLSDRFTRATSSTLRQQRLLAVCMLDLDGFKPVNDTYGHAVGDRLLLEVSERLNRSVRGEDTVARLGGDEFVLLLGDLKDIAETELMLQRIQAEITAPYLFAEKPIHISASIGVTVYPLDDADPDTLLRHADLAMFEAKQGGRSRHEMFNVAQDQQGQSYRQLAQRVQQALDNGEMRLFYQPKVNMRSGKVVGMEALIRWQHPERGLVPPMEFLPLVEQTQLMVDIGDWVMHEALNQVALWSAAGRPWPVSVNIAPRHFQHPEFLSRLKTLLAQHGEVSPRLLELEIVESAALGDVLHVGQLIADCQRELGVRFALDDFGTGYSSLTYLKRLPVDTLKIDQSFVRDILSDQEDLALVKGVIGLASVFKRAIVAEGVESPAHGALLLRLGCDVAQGYGIARPMPAVDVLAWSERYVADPSWAAAAKEYPTIG